MASPPRATQSPWIFGPLPDLLLGCGVGYVLLAVGLGLLPVEREALVQWGVLSSFVVGMAHYGATLVRVYEDPSDRRTYAFFTVWASLAVWSVFVVGVYSPVVGSALLTLYLNWSPWHYAGQNYGLAVLFLRRRGIPLGPASKRWLYASFLSSTALALLTLNRALGGGQYVPIEASSKAYRLLTLGIPPQIYGPLFGVVLLGHLATLAAFCAGLARRSSLAAALPALLLLATQALWFTVPSTALWATGRRIQNEYVVFFFLWAGIGHAAQYLWITTYYAVGTRPLSERAVYLGKTLLAGGLIFTVPSLLFAPTLLGRLPYELGLWLLVASAVNVQHFILDGAIWKLRDGPVARILIGRAAAGARARRPATEAEAPGVRAAAPWLTRAVWALAGLCTLVAIGGAWEYERGWIRATARGDHTRAALAERRLERLGRQNPLFHDRRAEQALALGEPDVAIAEVRAALALEPDAVRWQELATLQARRGEAEAALASLDRGFELGRQVWLDADAGGLEAMQERRRQLEASLLVEAGRYHLAEANPVRALELLERAAQRTPEDRRLRAELERLRRAGSEASGG